MMVESDYVFEQGDPVSVGSHGETNYFFISGEPVPNTGESNFWFESGHGLGGVPYVYTCYQDEEQLQRRDPSDMSIVESLTVNSTRGIGGDDNVLWVYDRVDGAVEERDPNDLSVISSTGSTGLTEVGGDVNNIYGAGRGSGSTQPIYELATSDMSVIQSASYPGPEDSANGAGGDGDVMWTATDQGNSEDYTVYQQDGSNIGSTIKTVTGPHRGTNGTGGDINALYQATPDADDDGENDDDGSAYYHLDPNDGSVIASRTESNIRASAGAGGT